MKIGDKCLFLGSKGDAKVIILDIKEEYGSSIKNDAMQTMDLVLTKYFKINYFDQEIWVTRGFLSCCNNEK